MRTLIRIVAYSLALAMTTTASTAVTAAESWISLSPNFPAGSPATVTFDSAASTPQQSVFEVILPGFWSETVVGPDGVPYQTMRVPGLPQIGKVGAPDLPAVRRTLAVVTGAPKVTLASMTTLAQATVPSFRPYPTATPGMDEDVDPTADPGPGDTLGSDDVFTRDESIYGGAATWPPSSGVAASPVVEQVGGVPGGDCECYPARWNPSTSVLTVATVSRFTFSHGGTATAKPALNKGEFEIAKKVFFNISELAGVVYADLDKFKSRYLIVTPSQYVDELQPFIQHKKSLGYGVVVQQLSGGETFLHILNYIADWYLATILGNEHYCLLVGDVDVIPLAYDIGSITFSDDPYGSPLDLDLHEEVYVGRLSVDSATDLSHQLKKIIDYEANPTPGDYDDVLLVAHKQGAPNKYQGAHEVVRLASYTNHPDFKTHYGSVESSNQPVLNDIAIETGLVCYRGHGSTNVWAGWNLADGSFHKNDVIGLTNKILPVVWSISCTNHNLTANDCIGEAWLEVSHGAIASYGATRGTGTKANHELDRALFKAVYDLGFLTHAHAIAYAEREMKVAYPTTDNAWAYNLLGDPSMKVRADPLLEDLKPDFDAFFVADGTAKDFDVKVAVGGVPLMGALVALYKHDNSPAMKDDVFVNTYTRQNGVASFQIQPKTLGDLIVTVQDGKGNIATAKAAIIDPLGCQLAVNETYGTGKAGSTGVPALSGFGLPVIGATSGIRIVNALPGAVPFLALGLASAAAPFDGGKLLVSPFLVTQLPVPIQADGTLTITAAIPADPALCGVALYHQMFWVDPGAAGFYHLAISNGLKRTFGGS